MSMFGAGKYKSDKNSETYLKDFLIKHLSECVKACQYIHKSEDQFHSILGSDDSTNSLCMALEAILIHGLKNTFFRKAKSAFSADPGQRPQPSFWPLVLLVSHKQSIKQIVSLDQITTEIGQCRAWLRTALNDSLLSSYLDALLKNMSAAKSYYNKSAFILDSEVLDRTKKVIEGLETCIQFELPLNSSLYNTWPDQVLTLARIWTPPVSSLAAISAGIDIASTMQDMGEVVQEDINQSIIAYRTAKTGLGQLTLQDEALDYILAQSSNTVDSILVPTTPNSVIEELKYDEREPELEMSQEESITSVEPKDTASESLSPSEPEIISSDEANNLADPITAGNSLMGKTCWLMEHNDDTNISVTSISSHGSGLVKITEPSQIDDSILRIGFNAEEIRKSLHVELNSTEDDKETIEVSKEETIPEDPILDGLGFEIVSNSLTPNFTRAEVKKLITQLGALSKEHGLDAQDYQCRGCGDVLGSIISKAKVCAYSGEYYCTKCMDTNVFMIPARVIHNWDFKRYHVSKKAAQFLLEFQNSPLIDMKKMNPKIYHGVDSMYFLKRLRIQLHYLKSYLFTCRQPVIEELQRRIWPREYLYEHIHQYSISDLAQIPNGSLALQLERVVSYAKNHVKECWLCSQRGFICEVCNDPKILFPFEYEATFRCEGCSSVFHNKCLTSNMPCPKCERQQKRKDMSLVDTVHSKFT